VPDGYVCVRLIPRLRLLTRIRRSFSPRETRDFFSALSGPGPALSNGKVGLLGYPITPSISGMSLLWSPASRGDDPLGRAADWYRI